MPLPLTTVLADLPDPRIETANKLHRPTDIPVIATGAVIAGADGREDIAGYGRSEEDFFRRFPGLPDGVPSRDTLERVFAEFDPDAFADRFGRWMAGLCEATGLVHVAVDGKSARRPPKGRSAGACTWSARGPSRTGRSSAGGRCPTAATGSPRFPTHWRRWTSRARRWRPTRPGARRRPSSRSAAGAGTTRRASRATGRGLRDAAAGVFERAGEVGFAGCDTAGEVGGAHGREEERYVTGVRDPGGLPGGWADVGAVALVCRERRVKGGPNGGTGRCHLTSPRVGAAELAGYTRSHRGIENGPHWVLGVSSRGDDSRTRAGHAAANRGTLRRVAVPPPRRAKTRSGIQTRRKKAGWDDDYLLQVLQGTTAE